MSKIIFHPDKCTGCSMCGLACSQEKIGAYSTRGGFIHITNLPESFTYKLDACFLCKEYSCVNICPKKALTIEEGHVVLDESLCVKCKLCVKKCAHGMAILKNGLPKMCDACGICIKICPRDALELA